MTGNEDFRGGNFIGGSGNITTGTFTDSPVVSVSGSNNKVTTDVSEQLRGAGSVGETWRRNWPG